MDWKIILKIIGDCIGFIWNSILYIIGSIFTVATFVWVVRMWRGWTKYKKEVKLNHSKDLVKGLSNIEIDLYIEKNIFKLEVKPYPDEINEHLKDDVYKDKKELIDRRDFYINNLHNEELKVFYTDLQGSIINYIKQRNFIEFDLSRSSVGQINFFNKITIESDILRVIHNNYQASESLSFRIDSHDNFHYLYCNYNQNIWVVSDDKKELEEIKKEVLKIFNDAIKGKKFELLLWYYKKIREYQTHINKELKQLINKVNDVKIGVPLEGKCRKCPKEDTLLEYTWQRIDKYLQ